MNKENAGRPSSSGPTYIHAVLERHDHVRHVGATVEDVVPPEHHLEPSLGHIGPLGAVEIVAASKEGSTDIRDTDLVMLVRAQLEEHPHFRGRSSQFTIDRVCGTIVVTGRFPSFYLKQLLQEAITVTPGAGNIDNQVHVVWPNPQSRTFRTPH